MSCGCGCGGATSGGAGCCQPGFTKPSGPQLAHSLGQELIPVVDGIRDLYTSFGLRPYVVRLIKTQWSAGSRGYGTEIVTFAREFLPTPRLLDLSGVTEILQPIGLDETGGARVTQISGRFTEDQLRGFDDAGDPPQPNEQVFYTVEFLKPGGRNEIRRFAMRNAPYYAPDKFEWEIMLERSHVDPISQSEPAS